MCIFVEVVPTDAAERLFALVDAKYKEQKEFAAEIGVIPQRVSAWRKGTSKSFTKYLPQITAALGTTAEYILTGKENSPATEAAGLTQEFARIFDTLSPQSQNEIIAEMLKRQRQEQ